MFVVLKEFHEVNGHIGKKRMHREVVPRYYFVPQEPFGPHIRRVKEQCLVCQASERPFWKVKGPIEFYPIPERAMASVSLDVFSMPEVQWDHQTYDCILLCVDRLSGWVLAKPSTKLGLTAKKAAHLMMDGGWEAFGVPTTITSDMGAQFVGQWWKTMCARLGIRQAYSQAHRPQANGRAERAGQQLIELLKKIECPGENQLGRGLA